MADKSYRAAIIGLGFIGGADQVSGDALGQRVSDLDGTHLAALTKHPRVELVAGSSRDLGRRERFASRTRAHTYADWRELLAGEELDLVSVATYAPQHAEITVACAKQGIRAIYCEKPMATRLCDAERMIQACEASGALLVINHNRRFNPNYRRLRDFIAAGELGDLTSGLLQWSSGRLGGVGTHMIDACRMLTGRAVHAVSGTLDLAGKPDCRGPDFRDPGAWGVMRLAGELMIFVDARDYASVPLQIILNGSKGRATVLGDGVTIEYWDGNSEQWPSVGKEVTSMDRAIAEIVAHLDQKAPFPYAAKEAASTLEAILAFHASHDRNAAWVTLPLSDENRTRQVRSS